MKENPDMRLIFLSCCLFLFVAAHAQLKQTSILRTGAPKKRISTARVQSLPVIELPFWDDFSFNNSAKNYANENLWSFGKSVWVNDGMAINPPTLKVATFDGLDSLGKPYNVNQALAKGIADSLVSRPIRMDLVDPTRRDSVFIFFYYQFQGNGEPPDPGDEFSLWFKNDSSIWVKVWNDTIRNHDNTKFVPVKFFISDSHFFHGDFQFRFQNFARLSGPFDTWNLDYVYINNGKSQYPVFDQNNHAVYRSDFPDRAIATPMTSLLQQYSSVPVKHLLSKADTIIGTPSLTLTNQRRDQAPPDYQSTNLITRVRTITRQNHLITNHGTTVLDSITTDAQKGLLISYGVTSTIPLVKMPSFKSFDPGIDSIALKFFIKLNTSDHENKIDINTGDYDTVVYKPIEFRYNDTTSTNFIFSNYYAYDDGVAEYAATLTEAGNYLAYEFNMVYSKPDTLVAVDFYFPHVGDETNQVIHLMIFKKLETGTRVTRASVYTEQDLTVARTENNRFIRVPLDTAQIVSETFYVGYRQNSAATIGVGLDKNSDSGGKIFANIGTGWLSPDLHGNLMIRPVFGNSINVKGPITEVADQKLFAYPNPNHGVFNFPQAAQNLCVFDIAGRSVSFVQEDSFEATRIILNNPTPGIYLVRYFNGTKWQTEKIMVLP